MNEHSSSHTGCTSHQRFLVEILDVVSEVLVEAKLTNKKLIKLQVSTPINNIVHSSGILGASGDP